MPHKDYESQMVLALRAMQNDPKLSARAAGKIYSVDHEKLSRRTRGMERFGGQFDRALSVSVSGRRCSASYGSQDSLIIEM